MTDSAGRQASPQAVLSALAAGAACVCVIAPSLLRSVPSGFTVGIVFGAFVGFNAIPVIWAALGPGRLAARVSLAFLVTLAFFLNLLIGFGIADGGPGSFKEFLQLIGVLPVIFLVVQSPFALMRMLTGWRLARGSLDFDEQGHGGRQFGIAELLTVTTFIAFALAMARWSFSRESASLPWAAMLMQLGIMLVWVSVVGPPCVWVVFRVQTLPVSAAITALHAGLMILLVLAIVLILSGGQADADSFLFVGFLHAATFTVLWSGLATLRRLGYSLGPRQMRNDRFHPKREAPAEGVDNT